MSNLNEIVIRIKADSRSFDNPVDALRSDLPQFWRGNSVKFELGIFSGDDILSVSNFAKVSLVIRPMTRDGMVPSSAISPLLQKECTTFDSTVTVESWSDGSGEHITIGLSPEESNIVPGDHWLSIWAETSGQSPSIVTLCAGIIRVLEAGGGSLATPPEPLTVYYTATQCDGKFVALSAIDSNVALGSSDSAIPSQRAVKIYVDGALATGGDSGEVNTASNVGSGFEIFSEKIGTDLQFRTLVAGSNVAIYPGESELTISAAAAGMENPMESSGDMVIGGSNGIPTRLPIGTEGQVLAVGAGGPQWASGSGGGEFYSLPIATGSTLGGIKPDGATLFVDETTGVASGTTSDCCLPGTESISINAGSSGSVYTSPVDGWLTVSCLTTSMNGWATVLHNYDADSETNDGITSGAMIYPSNRVLYIICPLAAGDVFRLNYGNANITNFKIIHTKGAQ
jgi:hypothetical protein